MSSYPHFFIVQVFICLHIVPHHSTKLLQFYIKITFKKIFSWLINSFGHYNSQLNFFCIVDFASSISVLPLYLNCLAFSSYLFAILILSMNVRRESTITLINSGINNFKITALSHFSNLSVFITGLITSYFN